MQGMGRNGDHLVDGREAVVPMLFINPGLAEHQRKTSDTCMSPTRLPTLNGDCLMDFQVVVTPHFRLIVPSCTVLRKSRHAFLPSLSSCSHLLGQPKHKAHGRPQVVLAQFNSSFSSSSQPFTPIKELLPPSCFDPGCCSFVPQQSHSSRLSSHPVFNPAVGDRHCDDGIQRSHWC
jgi:hypothetical protein